MTRHDLPLPKPAKRGYVGREPADELRGVGGYRFCGSVRTFALMAAKCRAENAIRASGLLSHCASPLFCRIIANYFNDSASPDDGPKDGSTDRNIALPQHFCGFRALVRRKM